MYIHIYIYTQKNVYILEKGELGTRHKFVGPGFESTSETKMSHTCFIRKSGVELDVGTVPLEN